LKLCVKWAETDTVGLCQVGRDSDAVGPCQVGRDSDAVGPCQVGRDSNRRSVSSELLRVGMHALSKMF